VESPARSEDHETELNESESRRAALDEILIAELARGRTYEEAGATADCSARTVGRRMRDPAFRRLVWERRSEWASEITGQLIERSGDAVDIVYEEARTAERSADRIRAATMLLNLGHRFRQAYELEERLRAVEEQLGLRTPTDGVDPDEAAT
jgi:hypothetical protein